MPHSFAVINGRPPDSRGPCLPDPANSGRFFSPDNFPAAQEKKRNFISVRSRRDFGGAAGVSVPSGGDKRKLDLLHPSRSPSTSRSPNYGLHAANGLCSAKLKSTSGAPQIRRRLETWRGGWEKRALRPWKRLFPPIEL